MINNEIIVRTKKPRWKTYCKYMLLVLHVLGGTNFAVIFKKSRLKIKPTSVFFPQEECIEMKDDIKNSIKSCQHKKWIEDYKLKANAGK